MNCPHCFVELNGSPTKCPYCTGNIDYEDASEGYGKVLWIISAIGGIFISYLANEGMSSSDKSFGTTLTVFAVGTVVCFLGLKALFTSAKKK